MVSGCGECWLCSLLWEKCQSKVGLHLNVHCERACRPPELGWFSASSFQLPADTIARALCTLLRQLVYTL